MQKKIFIIISMLFLGVASIFANLNYRFDLFSLDPLHKEYFADRARADMSLMFQKYKDGIADRVLQDTYTNNPSDPYDIKVWEFSGDLLAEDTMMEVKLGETLSFFRNTITFDNKWISSISFDLSAQAVIQSFYSEEFNNGVGYDGIYFYGGTFKIGDMFSMRIGKNHYCSHYGDGIFKLVHNDYLDNPSFDEFNIGYKYIRMNSNVFGLSITPNPAIRFYGELNIPPKDIYSIRPNMFAPNWLGKNTNYPDSYKARIVNFGIEFTYPIFKSLGNTTIGYDIHMYEEGKIVYDHLEGGSASYQESEPWEIEHNIVLAQEVNETTSFEITYHKGRSPFNNFFFLNTSYLGFGIRFNPNNTIKLFETNN